MTKNTIEVVALVVDSGILSFYKTDGSVYTITQGDPRGPELSDHFFAERELGKEVITLTLIPDNPVIGHLSSKKRNPLIRFFKARVDDVKRLFGDEVKHNVEGSEATHEAAAQKVREVAARLFSSSQTKLEQHDDLPIKMVHSEGPLEEGETIIAVTADGIVPEVESLADQFQATEEGKATDTGPDNLLLRLAKMSAKRGHTGQELMKFVKKIDLPILADGSFLAYKRLIHKGGGLYVDPHSQLVHQRIGDVVQMDESLVDPNRRQECSTGLHVGTRHYMGGFHGKGTEGSGTMLVLVQPEDAIAIPSYEASKGRMMRYTILADLGNKAHDLVNENKRMDSDIETMTVLAQIVAGARPPMLGVVNISGAKGSKLTYTINGQQVETNLSLEQARQIAKSDAKAADTPVKEVRTIDESKQDAGNMVPEKVRTKEAVVKPTAAKEKAVAMAPVPGASERTKKAAELYARMTDKANTDADRQTAAQDLKTFKSKAKVSYEKLGLPADAANDIEEILVIVATPAKTSTKQAKTATETAKTAVTTKKQPDSAPAKKPAAPAPVKEKPVATSPQNETRQDKARRLWNNIVGERITQANRKAAAEELQKFKKTAKVSWDALGLGNHNVEAELKKYLG